MNVHPPAKRSDPLSFHTASDLIMEECRTALSLVDPDAVERLLEAVLGAEQVFFIGVGRVLLSMQAMAKRLSHLGIHTVVVGQITEPAITKKDLLIVASGSGETLFPVAIAKKAKSLGAKVAHIGSNSASSLAPVADVFVRIPVRTKLELPDEIVSRQPMTSLFEQSLLIFGDALAAMIVARKNLDVAALWKHHANLE